MTDLCSWQTTLNGIAIAFFGCVSTFLTAFLAHRRILADRERKNGGCKWCRAHHERYRHEHEQENGPIGPEGLQ